MLIIYYYCNMGVDFTNRPSFEELSKLPAPTNAGLNALFTGIDTVLFKRGGVYNGQSLTNEIVLAIVTPDDIQQLNRLLELNETSDYAYCMCLGDYGIELHAGNRLSATLGFHHGQSIRYDFWRGDGELVQQDSLLTFLAEKGLVKPLEERHEILRNMQADRLLEQKWKDAAPNCFTSYWKEIKSGNEDYYPSLLHELNVEIPDLSRQIIVLLQTFGITDHLWTGYPVYEALPEKILQELSISLIITSYLNSDRNYKTRKGLMRFLCSFEFKKTRTLYLNDITQEVINDLENYAAWTGDQRIINEVFNLLK